MRINQSKTQIKKQSSVIFLLPLLILLFVVLLTGCTMPLSAIRSEAFSGKIVDKETGKPIEGAIVVMKWPRRSGNYAVVRTLGIVDIQEVLSDKNGVYHIEGWKKYKKDIGKGAFTTSAPKMYIYKPGYWALELTNDIRRNRALELFEAWKSDWDGKTIELEPMHSEKWRRKEWEKYALYSYDLNNARAPGRCGWIVTPNILLELSRLKKRIQNGLGEKAYNFKLNIVLIDFYEEIKIKCHVDPYMFFTQLGLTREEAKRYWKGYKKLNNLAPELPPSDSLWEVQSSDNLLKKNNKGIE